MSKRNLREVSDFKMATRKILARCVCCHKVKPRVITHFEPWMALSFTEGSIGGDIEKVDLNQLEASYGSPHDATAI